MTETTQFRREQRTEVKRAGCELARSGATILTRVVPMRTLYLELSVRRDNFDEEAMTDRSGRHPEWYIG